MPPDQLPLQRAARGEEVRNHEEEIRFDDGGRFSSSAAPSRCATPSGAPRGAIGAFVDVTRLKQAEAALREADRRKDEFLALLSHELRNPLAPILTAAQLLKLRGDAAASQELEVISASASILRGSWTTCSTSRGWRGARSVSPRADRASRASSRKPSRRRARCSRSAGIGSTSRFPRRDSRRSRRGPSHADRQQPPVERRALYAARGEYHDHGGARRR